jgi:L-alanine-DL-glutamate epimerase-like enolase superfamily enzyme
MAQFRGHKPKKKYHRRYKIQMAYPSQKTYYDMDMTNTKAKAEAKIRQMKREGYSGMKFKIKKSTRKFIE